MWFPERKTRRMFGRRARAGRASILAFLRILGRVRAQRGLQRSLRTGSPCRDRVGLLNVPLAEGINPGLRKMAEATTTHGVLGIDAHRALARRRGSLRPGVVPWSSRPRPRLPMRPSGARGGPPRATASSFRPPAAAKPSTWSTPATGPYPASRGEGSEVGRIPPAGRAPSRSLPGVTTRPAPASRQPPVSRRTSSARRRWRCPNTLALRRGVPRSHASGDSLVNSDLGSAQVVGLLRVQPDRRVSSRSSAPAGEPCRR